MARPAAAIMVPVSHGTGTVVNVTNTVPRLADARACQCDRQPNLKPLGVRLSAGGSESTSLAGQPGLQWQAASEPGVQVASLSGTMQ